MCTVTFIPQEKNGFILSSNRDVNAERSPQSISQIRQNGKTLTFPRDVTAGGTWIAFSDSDQMVCLLNGAFENHKHNPPYRRSRGLMVLDYFDFPTTEDFIAQYDFEGIEPFTFIIYDNGNLHELRWDEQQLHHTPLSTSGYYIWSSSTLYSPDIRQKRQQWFDNWLNLRNGIDLAAIQSFHLRGGEPDPWNGFIMNRHNLVQTVSMTNVVKNEKGYAMEYEDFISGRHDSRPIKS